MKSGYLGLAAAAVAGVAASTPAITPAIAPAVATATTSAKADPPNVVLILVDDARADDMSTLPGVKRLVGDQGARFAGTVSPFPLCSPARATLLTGRYAHNHHVLGNEAPLGGFDAFTDTQTLATWLDPTYDTALIGKYLNGYQLPYVPPGWDYWASPTSMWDYRAPGWEVNGSAVSLPGYRTTVTARLATSYIADHAGSGNPFFLYTAVLAPHEGSPAEPDDPSMPTPNVQPRYRDRFAGRAVTDPSFNEADVSDKPVRPPRLTPAQVAAETEVNAQRRESLLSVQDLVRQIVTKLSNTGELDNTYLWFVSDNGYLLGEHRISYGKVAPYQVAVRVPMMVRGPGIAKGTVVRQPTSLVDFAPTVLAMTGQSDAHAGPALDGISLVRVLSHPAARTRPVLIEAGPRSSTASPSDAYHYHGIVAIVDHTRWKYVVRSTGARELYDLTHDPHELVNVAGLASTAATQARMQTLLTRYEWCAGSSCTSAP